MLFLRNVIFSVLFLLTSLSAEGANSYSVTDMFDDEVLLSPKTPIEIFVQAIEWDLFMQEFEIYINEIETCTTFDITGTRAPMGFMMHQIEVSAFMEAVGKDWYFRTINFDLKQKSKVNGITYLVPLGEARSGGRQSAYHYIKFPLFGMLGMNSTGFFCFDTGELDFGYLSEPDPSAQIPGARLRMFADMVQLFSPQGLASSIFDCVTTTAADYLERPTEYDARVRNAYYFNCGCSGITTIGEKKGHTQDPLNNAMAATCSTINMMSYAGFLPIKSAFGMGVDSKCRPKYYPRLHKTQYKLQPIYPYVDDSIELGLSGMSWSNFKGNAAINDDAVFVVWTRRDYVAMAYACGSDAGMSAAAE